MSAYHPSKFHLQQLNARHSQLLHHKLLSKFGQSVLCWQQGLLPTHQDSRQSQSSLFRLALNPYFGVFDLFRRIFLPFLRKSYVRRQFPWLGLPKSEPPNFRFLNRALKPCRPIFLRHRLKYRGRNGGQKGLNQRRQISRRPLRQRRSFLTWCRGLLQAPNLGPFQLCLAKWHYGVLDSYFPFIFFI